jgi:RNA recognition motif-containing protein
LQLQEEFKDNPEFLKNLNKRKKKTLRKAADQAWVDPSLEDWDENDFRIFCGNMGNEVSDEVLANAFKKYPSFSKARVVRDKKTLKSKGFGFVSLLNVDDYIRAMREMQGKYVGNRPITLKRSDWQKKAALPMKH